MTRSRFVKTNGKRVQWVRVELILFALFTSFCGNRTFATSSDFAGDSPGGDKYEKLLLISKIINELNFCVFVNGVGETAPLARKAVVQVVCV